MVKQAIYERIEKLESKQPEVKEEKESEEKELDRIVFNISMYSGHENLNDYTKQIREYFARVCSNEFSIEGEQHIKDVALDFCKKQKI
jgi:hypothetical protein